MRKLFTFVLTTLLLWPTLAGSGYITNFPNPVDKLYIGSLLAPSANDGAALGSATYRWSDLFIASGGVINFAGGTTLTDSANALTLAGGSLVLPTIYGGIAANDDITIAGTSHGTTTTSYVILQPSGGLVGIGTTGPGDKLHVFNGDATIQENGSSSISQLRIQNDYPSYGGGDWWLANRMKILFSGVVSPAQSNSQEDKYSIGTEVQDGTGNTQFYLRDEKNNQTRIMILQNGNVGIGTTTNIDATLTLSGNLGFTATTNVSPDLFLSRENAAIIQMGADSATPIAQTIKGPDGLGADKAGGDFTSAPGRPTGTGTPGVHYIATSTTGTASNSTQQALVNRVKTTETGVEVLRDNLQSTKIASLTELTTIAAAATTDTTIQIPANAIVLGVSVRVTTVIPTAATFTVIGTTTSTAFQTGTNVSTAADTTDAGTKACPYLNTAAQTIRFTPNASPAANTGRVRVTIHYILITPPTS